MAMPVVATPGFELRFDLVEERIELVQRCDTAGAKLIDEAAELVVEVAVLEDLGGNPQQGLEGEEDREDDAVRLRRDITRRIELAGEAADVAFQLHVQFATPAG